MDKVFIALGFITELFSAMLKALGIFVMGGVIFGTGYLYGSGESNFFRSVSSDERPQITGAALTIPKRAEYPPVVEATKP